MTVRPPLWHFTCEHGYRGIGEQGTICCNPHLLLPRLGQLIWLTDDPEPDRYDVGLTSSMLDCDRMEYRYRVLSASKCIPWRAVRHQCPPDILRGLESFGAPNTWWISREPLRAVLAQPNPNSAGTTGGSEERRSAPTPAPDKEKVASE